MFSNLAFAKSGVGKGCALSEALAEHLRAGGTGTGVTRVTAADALRHLFVYPGLGQVDSPAPERHTFALQQSPLKFSFRDRPVRPYNAMPR